MDRSLLCRLTLGYVEDRYDFQGDTSLVVPQPWQDIRSLSLSLPLRYQASDAWNLFVLPTLRFSAEKDAHLGNGQKTGLIAAAGYRFDDQLTLGPGIGVFSDIEGDTSYFPILVINWQITETLSVETGRGLAASRGPGVTLRCRPDGPWRYSLGARYDKRRFRLSEDGPNPNGIGEEKTVPVALGIQYAFSRNASFSLLAGYV